MNIPTDIQTKLERIVDYLKGGGCSKIYLFGSMAEGTHRSQSDIDIAVSGISSREFFKAAAMLPFIAKHRVDLVDLNDLPPKYKESIESKGVVLYAN